MKNINKIRVFIDFEAISIPFSRIARIRHNFPYAYTLGLYRGDKFKTKTFVFDFKKHKIFNINELLRKQIVFDIRSLLNEPNFPINQENIEFVGWSPDLEKKILHQIFKNYRVSALNNDFNVSLSVITPEINDDYFHYVKKFIPQKMTPHVIKRRKMFKDGAIASYVGYLLYAQTMKKKTKFFFDFDEAIVLRELKRYSKEDVTRMHFLDAHPKLFHQRMTTQILLTKKKRKVASEIMKKRNMINQIQEFHPEMRLKDYLDRIKQEIVVLQQEINFNKFSIESQKKEKIILKKEKLIASFTEFEESLTINELIMILEKDFAKLRNIKFK